MIKKQIELKIFYFLKRVFLLLILFSYGCTSYQSLLNKGDKLLSEKELHKGVIAYEKALSKQPSKADAYIKLSTYYEEKGEYEIALNYLNKSIILCEDPLKQKTLIKTRIEIQLSQVADILELPYKSNSIDNYSYGQKILSNILVDKKTIQTNFPSNEQINQKQDKLTYLCAKKAIDQNDFQTAIQYINNLIAKDAKSEKLLIDILNISGELFLNQGKYSDAIFYFEQLYESTENELYRDKIEDIFLGFAETAFEQRKYIVAEEYLNKLETFNPGKYENILSDVLIEHANSIYLSSSSLKYYEKRKKYQFCLNLLNKIAYRNLKDKEKSLLLINDILIELSEEALALKLARESYDYLPFINTDLLNDTKMERFHRVSDKSLILLSKQSYENQEYERCIAYLNIVIKNKYNKENVELAISKRIDAYFALAEMLYIREQYVEALDYLNKILIDAPNNPNANYLKEKIRRLKAKYSYNLGLDLFKKRNYELAEYYLKNAGLLDEDYFLKSKLALSKLYKKAFLVSMSIESLSAYEAAIYGGHVEKTLTKNQLNYELAKLNSIHGKLESAKDYLDNLYCTSDYKTYMDSAKNEKSFYNLRNDLFFQLWVNGKQRIRLEIVSLNDIYDMDDWYSVSDPMVLIDVKNTTYSTGYYEDKRNLVFNKNYLIEDFKENEQIKLLVLDNDDNNIFRGDNEIIGRGKLEPFCRDEGVYTYSFKYATFKIAISRTLKSRGYYGLYKRGDNFYSQMLASISKKSCMQIGFETVAELFLTQLNYYPYLFVTIYDALNDGIAEASLNGIQSFTLNYLQKKYASEAVKLLIRQGKFVKILYDTYNEMKANNCW